VITGLLFLLVQVVSPDTIRIRDIERSPPPGRLLDTRQYGSPQIRLHTGQGTARIWLLRASDTVFLAAIIPDSTRYWGDDFVVSLHTDGEAAASPQHEDFQLYFRRMLDSSVVFRGRNGRWEPPRDDPDWRLGAARAGGGWEISSQDEAGVWGVLLRLDPAWLPRNSHRMPRIAFRIYDDAPGGWFSWPSPEAGAPATTVEGSPVGWAPVR
jgi:hypothetical protein